MTYSKYYWLNENSRTFLKRGYLSKDETPENRIKDIAINAEKILSIKGFAKKFENYMSKGYYSLSTPVWTNFGKDTGLPVSCFGSSVDDTLESILKTGTEIGMMSKYGGGTSAYLGNIRPRGSSISTGGYADGPTHYAEIYDTIIDKCSQGSSRRGSCAIYLPIDHKDINEFLNIGTEGNPIQNLQYGICIENEWMNSMIEGDKNKRTVWAKVLQARKETGFPYLFFKDTVNNNSPYKDLNLNINHSNLCSEIALPNSSDESFVCVLSSINLLHWEELIKTDAIETLVYFLNAVNKEFVKKSKNLPGMQKAYNFAKRHAAIGLGTLGYHSFLQSNLISFESILARSANKVIFKEISIRANKASKELYKFNPENFNCIRKGYANTTVMAIAPTKSSSYLLGQVSMGIEPIKSNYFIKDLAKIKTIFKNNFLKKELIKYDLDTEKVWNSIMKNDGSCQHLDFPTKEVFKSFIEISPLEIITQAAHRQKFIDQSQSLNVSIHSDVSVKDINKLYIKAWKLGVKTLYYQFNQSAAQNFARNINACSVCES